MKTVTRFVATASMLGASTLPWCFAGCGAPADPPELGDPSSQSAQGPEGSGDAGRREVRSTVMPNGEKAYYVVEAIDGVHPLLHLRTDESGAHVLGTTNPDAGGGWGGNQIQNAYGIAPTGGATTMVAVIDQSDNPNAESDLAVYRSTYGIPPCTTANGCFLKINENGATSPLPAPASHAPPPDAGDWAAEIVADIEMVSVTCPSCKILLVEVNDIGSPNAGWAAAVDAGAKFISNSFGNAETSFTRDASVSASYAYLRQEESVLAVPGVSFFAGTGDNGYGTIWPSTSAHVTAVSGTTLSATNTAPWWSESTWAEAGAGCSQVIGKPSWQTDTWCGAYRTVADVAALAAGVEVYDTWSGSSWTPVDGGPWITGYGTSLSTPLVAGIYASNGWNGAAPSYSYANPSHFTDITTGNDCTPNGGVERCQAGVGYDEPTGNGAPIGPGAPDVFYANPAAVSVPQNGVGYSTLEWGGIWLAKDHGADVTFTFSTALPDESVTVTYPTPSSATLQLTPPLGTGLQTYPLTVTATDPYSGISRTAQVEVTVTSCVPIACSPNSCGTIATTNGCGGPPVACGSCGSGMSCSSNVCCPAGEQWDSVIATCICEKGTTWSAAAGKCVSTCNTNACQCAAAGGSWNGKTCE